MYRLGFGVVTSVVAVLCCVAAFVLLMSPHISPRAANRLHGAHDDFLAQGQYEGINWIPFGGAAIVAARSENRPILLLIGLSTSPTGRYMDQNTFTDTEVAAYLANNFVCARIDGAIYPEWANAMLPVRRLDQGFRPDFQIWFLDAQGRPFGSVLRTEGNEDFSAAGFLPRAVEVHDEFLRQTGSGGAIPGLLQREDAHRIDQIATRAQSPPPKAADEMRAGARDFALYSSILRSMSVRNRGGLPIKGWVGLNPLVWRYLVMTGDRRTFELAVTHGILRTPMVDLLDGGFFHTMLLGDQRYIEFDKETVENAEAMLALAEAGALERDPLLRRSSENTWRYLATSFAGPAGFVQGQIGDGGPQFRSHRYSVSPRRLREAVRPALRQWALDNLGLDSPAYPQTVPFFSSNVVLDPRLGLVMDDLRRTANGAAPSVDAGEADISCTCCARGIQVGRIWKDAGRLARTTGWLSPLESLRSGDDVMRRIGDRREGRGYLGDYLAYCDAHLQAYLATGREEYLDTAMPVLRRAWELFRSPAGMWLLARRSEAMPVADPQAPEIADNLHEGCSARVVRLLMGYGRLLAETDEGRRFQAEARRMVDMLRPTALEGGLLTAGLKCAGAEVFDPSCFVTVGPDARSLSDILAQQMPTRMSFPAVGRIRKDLQTRSPGVYVVGQTVVGPFTAREAEAFVGWSYDFNRDDSAAVGVLLEP